MSQYGIDPMYHTPMSNEEFLALQRGQLQDLQLYDRQELIETARHYRAMERDAQKSQLRNSEYVFRQQFKAKNYQYVKGNGEILMDVITGTGQVIKKTKVFSCEIVDLYRFQYECSDSNNFFQIVLKTGDKMVYSPLYHADILQSAIKMQKTILGIYDCTTEENEKRAVWKWVKKELFYTYEQKNPIRIPYYAGWFQMQGTWFFRTKTEETELVNSEVIKMFSRPHFENLNADEIVNELRSQSDIFSETKKMGVLLLIRLVALLNRLETDTYVPMGLTLIGPNAVQVAKVCLCTMDSGSSSCDIANLDSDRMGRIRENLKKIQDTPVIFVYSYPDNKSTQNRLSEIMSWMESGLMEGKRIKVPFVFCLKNFSPQYPLSHSVVVQTDDIHVTDSYDTFKKFQEIIISKIESSGEYWIKELINQYQQLKEELADEFTESIFHIGKAMCAMVLRMLNLETKNEHFLRKILLEGLDEVRWQDVLKPDILLEVFRQNVVEMVNDGAIYLIPIQNEYTETKEKIIFYDEDFYYFHKSVLQMIADESIFDGKSILYIKKTLASKDLIKQYKETGNRRSELEVDILIGREGKKERLSVLAIKRIFWDEAGGVALFERSGDM